MSATPNPADSSESPAPSVDPGPAASTPRPPGTPNSQTPLVRDNRTLTSGESFWKAAGRFQPMR